MKPFFYFPPFLSSPRFSQARRACALSRPTRALLLVGGLLFFAKTAQAQAELSADSLFTLARSAAFDRKDYPKAVELCQQALAKSPGYNDIRNFLGRIYTWTDQLDDARREFDTVLKNDLKNRDAYSGLVDLNFWNNRSPEALTLVNAGLAFHPTDEELLLKKARILNDLNQLTEANAVVTTLLTLNPKNNDARALAARLRWSATKNAIAVSYDYLHFDRGYNDALHLQPWHVLAVQYSHQTKLGSVLGRINYAQRFGENGLQFEVDAYPRISPTFYAYVNAGVSTDQPVFPHFRAGASLYANLPRSFEGEVGFRLLQFSSNTWIYTASVGKYWKSWWFNLRTFTVPASPEWSKSLIFTARYYFGGADDYISVGGGSGISPDETRNVLLEGNRNLPSQRVNLEWRKSFNRINVITLNFSYFDERLPNGKLGRQWSPGVAFRHYF